jgi:uncharacterized membrane protein
MNGAIREAARRYRVPLLDLATAIPGGRSHFVDASHFTKLGEQQVAEEIDTFLLQAHLVAPNTAPR